MVATGIVRRIDDLGRIVIPKEIRKALKITEGQAMEIFTENDRVIFQRYQTEEKASEYLDEAIRILAEKDSHNELRTVLEQISRMIADFEECDN